MQLLLEKRWIQVLGAVRNAVHAHHQQHEIEKTRPVAENLAAIFLERGARLLPSFRFFYLRANEKREQRGKAADKEHRPPSPARVDVIRHRGGQKITGGIAFLQ